MKKNTSNPNTNMSTAIWDFFFKIFDNFSTTFNLAITINNRYLLMTITILAIIFNFGVAQAQVTPVIFPNGGFEIDGNLRSNDPTVGAGDWIQGAAGNGGYLFNASWIAVNPAITSRSLDAYNGNDNIFNGGLKFNDNPNTWGWKTSKSTGKNDINNTLIHLGADIYNNQWLFIASDRLKTDGTSYIDFEFFQSSFMANANGSFTSAGTAGGRTVGDLLITVEYAGGGTDVSIYTYLWKAIGSGYAYVLENTPNAYGKTNTINAVTLPGAAFGLNSYEPYQFVEAAINMTAFYGGLIDPCTGGEFGSVLVKTKSSVSPSSDLEDFAGPFPVKLNLGTATIEYNNDLCGSSATPSIDGVNGGTFSVLPHSDNPSAPALAFDASTGEISIAENNRGFQYIVRYDYNTGGCSKYDTTIIFIPTIPTITGTTSNSRCGTGTVTLGATASAGIINWYAALTGGASLGTGTSFTTPSISSTTTYYVDATVVGGCTTLSRTAVTATVNAIPTITGTTPNSRCGTGTVTLNATASAGIINWYAAASGGASLGTGTSFTTPSISSTTTYYVDATAIGCTTGTRTEVVATVNTIPTITGTTPNSRCGTGTVTLSATASAGTINWYANLTGGTSLGTGTTFTTPSISSTTTYYVDATAIGCTTGTRTAVIATVYNIPTITGTTPSSRCGTGTITLSATASAGTINWYAAASGGTSLGTGISFTTPSISETTTYYVDATDIGCTTVSRTAVIATVNPLPIINQVIGTNPTIATCPTLNNGTITINASGSNLQYSINNGVSYQSSNIFNGLTSGTYQIVVKNNTTNCFMHHTENVVLTNPICVSEVSIVATTNAGEPNTNGLFTLTLTHPLVVNTEITYTVAGTAANGTDYTTIGTKVTILANQTSVTIPVIVIDDNIIEPTETVIITLISTNTLVTVDPAKKDATVNITDNDGGSQNGIIINDVTVNEGAGNAIFNVTLTGNVQGGFTVNYATANGSAIAPGDFTSTSGILTFTGNNNEVKTITVPIIDDNLIEPTESFYVNLSDLSTTLIGINDNQGIGTITDNDGSPQNGIIINDVTVNEADGNATFTVTLTGNVQGGFTVDYATADNSAIAPGDYTNTSGTLTFTGNNNEEKTVTVPIIDDNLIEPTESFYVNLSDLSTTLIGINDNQGIGTITDNDGSPQNGIIINDVTVNEGAGNAIFNVTLTGNVQGGFTVNYATANGSAIAPGDFTSTSGILTFTGNNNEIKTITVPIIDDNLIEPTESFYVNLSDLSTTLISINDGQGLGTIIDNDGGPQNGLVINDVTVNEGAGNAIFTVTLTGNVQGAFTVNYATANGSAIAPGDYTVTSGSLTFNGTTGETKTITVPIINDNLIEPTENFFVNLSSLSTSLISINDNQGIGTIIDNDGGPQNGLVINNVTVNEDAGNAIFTVTLTGNVQGAFTVNYATANGSAIAPGDFTSTSGILTFTGNNNEVKTITVPIIDDNLIEPTESFYVNLSDLSTTLIGINDNQGIGTITDNDGSPQNGIMINNVTVNEADGNATFTVTLTGNVQGGFTVDYATADNSAIAPGDYTNTSGTLTFTGNNDEEKTVTVPIIDDNLIEPTESFYVNLSDLSTTLIGINDNQGIGTITDNDGSPQNGIIINDVTVNEAAGNAIFNVTLTGNVQGGFTVNYATANGSAIAPGDYTSTSETLTFDGTDGETQNIIVPIIDDNLIEPTESFYVNLSELSTDLIGINDAQGEGTITDNDGGTENGIAINDVTVNESDGNAIFTVTLTGNVQGGFTVNYTTENGSASAPDDYTSTSETLTFDGTDGENHNIIVPIIDDNLIESTENFFVNLSELSTTLISINDAQGEGTITDNDGSPQNGIVINDVSVNEGAGNAIFNVTLTGNVQGGFTVNYATANGSASAPDDYTTASGTLTFVGTTGETHNVVVPIIDDNLIEPTENFFVNLSELSTTLIGINDNQGTGTITDNDGGSQNGITINDVTVNEDAGNATFSVTLTGNVQGGFTVNYATANGSASAPDDYTSTSETLTFDGTDGETQNIIVPIIDDNLIEPTENFFVNLSELSTTLISINDTQGEGIIIDNDLNVNNDAATAIDSDPVTIDILTNDSFGPDDTIESIVIISNPENGTVTIDSNNNVIYTANNGYFGPDTFNYTLTVVNTDGSLNSGTATVTVTVNVSPNATDDLAETESNIPLDIDILDNDTDADGTIDPTSVTIIDAPENGTVVINTNGTVNYTPDLDFIGDDTFTYQVCDNDGLCDTANVSVVVAGVLAAELIIPEGFSPNDDGVHDEFDVEGLSNLYPDFKMTIFNRWGVEVYDYTHNGNPLSEPIWWDGYSRGRMTLGNGPTPVGTYFYILYFNKDGAKPRSGYLYLNR